MTALLGWALSAVGRAGRSVRHLALTSIRLPGKLAATSSSELTMASATLTEKGQIVIPIEIRTRYGLTPGTQLEFVDESGVIRLLIRRRVARTDPSSGFGLIKAKPPRGGASRRLSEFDPASLLKRK